jgi:hypothetical protein
MISFFRNMGDEPRYMADDEISTCSNDIICVVRKLFLDGSGYSCNRYGEEHCIYPPENGEKYSIELDETRGNGKNPQNAQNAYTLSTSDDLEEAKDYIKEIIRYIQGPGQYSYFIYENLDFGKTKLVYEYHGTNDYDEKQHDESFDPECMEDD